MRIYQHSIAMNQKLAVVARHLERKDADLLRQLRRAALLLALLATLVACASAPAPNPAPAQVAGAGGRDRLTIGISFDQPGLGLRVAGIGAALKGRHTTVSARVIPLDCGGWVADTPGLRELGLWGIDVEELRDCFPELRARAEACRFGSGCSHVHEPSCAVRAAVDAGEIDRERYESYIALHDGGEC